MRILVISMGDVIMELTHQGFLKAGIVSHIIDARSLSSTQINSHIDEFKPDVCLINNYDLFMIHCEGEKLEELLNQKGISILSWYFESPELSGTSKLLIRWIQGPHPKNIHFLVTDSHFVDFFKKRGASCGHLPLGVDPHILSKVNPKVAVPTSSESMFFSGSCLPSIAYSEPNPSERLRYTIHYTLKEFHKFIGAELHPEFIQLYQQTLEVLFKDWKTISPHYRQKREYLIGALTDPLTNFNLKIAFTVYQSRIDIIFSLFQLYEVLRFLGDKWPLSVQGTTDWQLLNLKTIFSPRHLSQSELLSSYSKSLAVFCHTKHAFQKFVHERVLMTFGVGGLPITDKRDDLDYFFDVHDIPTYSDASEIVEILRFYSRNLEKRAALISKGQQKILSLHTYDDRAKSIIDYIRKNGLTRSRISTSSQDTLSPSIQVPS